MSEHIFSAISAVGLNGEIGRNNDLVFVSNSDMQLFVKTTMGKTVIMGSRTFESLGNKPLKGRNNIVITRKIDNENNYLVKDNVIYANSIDTAMQLAKIFSNKDVQESVFIGGATIYKLALPYISKLYLSKVKESFPDADTFFPKYDESQWDEVETIHYDDFDFVTYTKKTK